MELDENIVSFVENYFNIELLTYQKKLLMEVLKQNDVRIINPRHWYFYDDTIEVTVWKRNGQF